MVRRKQFGALLMAAIMSVTGISVPQSAEPLHIRNAIAIFDCLCMKTVLRGNASAIFLTMTTIYAGPA